MRNVNIWCDYMRVTIMVSLFGVTLMSLYAQDLPKAGF